MTETLQEVFRKINVYRRRSFTADLIASIVVFLVAIPLCLGIGLASGAPLLSGIISGIVGGIVVGLISGSAISVSGPAAGMVTVVIAALAHLGTFEAFLLAVFFSGFIQIFLGRIKAGLISNYIPSNVVQGLLCAIGLLIIVKQLPLAFTLNHSMTDLYAQLLDDNEGLSLAPIMDISYHINSGALIISLISLSLLIFFDKTKNAILKVIPGAIVVVLVGIILNEFFTSTHSYFAQGDSHLVNIPRHNGFFDLIHQLASPNWSEWKNPLVYFYAIMIAMIGSLETLLNIQAGEKLDPKRRRCSKDRELYAQGIGNIFAGLLGGLPITSVIVRTSVNIQTGAKTKVATLLHGGLICIAVILTPSLLNQIPLCSLATILIYTGYKLTKPSIYKSMYHQGLDRFIPFATTVFSIIYFNLIAGILIGLVISAFYILKSNAKARLDIVKEIHPTGETHRLILPQQTSFLNKALIVSELEMIPPRSKLIIDARYSDFIDKEVLEYIKEFQTSEAPYKNIALNLIGFKDKYNVHDYIDFINVTTYDVQTHLSPKQVLTLLEEGNQRFLEDKRIHRSLKTEMRVTAKQQFPMAIVVGCIDSRVPVETIFDMTFGDLFCIRIAGNVVNPDILASVEYACKVIGAKLIVVLGHTSCGAIAAACDGVHLGHVTQLLERIKPAIDAADTVKDHRNSQNLKFVNQVTQYNIANTITQLYDESHILHEMIDQQEIGIVGAIYNVASGKVEFENYKARVDKLDKTKTPQLGQNLTWLFE